MSKYTVKIERHKGLLGFYVRVYYGGLLIDSLVEGSLENAKKSAANQRRLIKEGFWD